MTHLVGSLDVFHFLSHGRNGGGFFIFNKISLPYFVNREEEEDYVKSYKLKNRFNV